MALKFQRFCGYYLVVELQERTKDGIFIHRYDLNNDDDNYYYVGVTREEDDE